jgi:ribose transport system permease protein
MADAELSTDAAASAPPRHSTRPPLRDAAEVGILVVLVAVFSILNPDSFPTLTTLKTILNAASIPIIVGVGATFVVLTGRIDLSAEGVMGAAGMTFVLLSANSRGTLDLGAAAVVIAILLGAGLGLATGLVHTRLSVPSFIVSLGMWYVGLGIAAVLFGVQMIPFLQSDALKLWPTSAPLGVPNSFVLALGVVVIGFLIEQFTRLGRYTYAIGNNEGVAQITGLPVKRYCLYVFMLSGACSALAGVLGSLQLGAGSATIRVGTLFLTLAAIVIGGTPLSGGKGGVMRTMLGVLILSTLYNGLILSDVSPAIQSGVSGAILIVAVTAAGWVHRERLKVVK